MAKRAFITGITGQDGSYLAELLLGLGYDVHALVRRVALEDPARRMSRIAHLGDVITLHAGSLENYASVFHAFTSTQYDECYHLAAQSFVAESFRDGFGTMDTNVHGTHYLLAVLRELQPRCRFYFAGSSEMFGKAQEVPQRESTPFYPRSPYGISKLAGHWLTVNYREAYGMHASTGILFNHESPRRGHEFVTRKITSTVARIKLGLATELRLGNLDAKRDWGLAADYVRAMHAMLQQDEPGTYVIATGETHSVRDFCQIAFAFADLDWRDYVVVDERYLRPADIDLLVGDASLARRRLGWEPTVTFEEICREMVQADLAALSEGELVGSGVRLMSEPEPIASIPPRPARRLRVLQIGKFYPPYKGGIETHVRELCLGLKDDVDITVVAANSGRDTVDEVLEGIRVRRIGTVGLVASAPISPGLTSFLREQRVDLIHLHVPHPTAALALFASRNPAPLVVSWHSEIVRQRLLGQAADPLNRWLVRRASAISVATPAHIATSRLLSRYRERCCVIPYGIDEKPMHAPANGAADAIRERFGPRIVLAVGRMVYYKGFDVLVRALARVPDAHLMLVGDGPLRAALQQEVDRLGLGQRVTFLRDVDDLVPYYQSADVFVLPSTAPSEAFGIVQLEAMACGLPVVNTALRSGAPLVSRHGESGLTVPPEALADAISRLLDDRMLAERLGAAGRQRVSSFFERGRMASRMLSLYHEILESGRLHQSSTWRGEEQAFAPLRAVHA